MDNIYEIVEKMYLEETTAIAVVSREDPTELLSKFF
jgi:hypothetical protein